MTDTDLTPTLCLTEATIRSFVAEQGTGLAPPTVQRYAIVTDSLVDFLDTVDVRPRLGPEIAAHLEAARERLGPGAFLPTLGVVSMLRVLPEFLGDPWLPPKGAQRRSHRTVVERLVTLLRRHVPEPGLLRDDFGRVRRAVGTARSRDYGTARSRDYDRRGKDRTGSEEAVTVTSTFELRQSLLDLMLDGVEEGRYASLDAAIESAVDPQLGGDAWSFHGW